MNKSPEQELPPTENDAIRNRLSVLIDEITVTTRALLANGVDGLPKKPMVESDVE